jgi:hypothetical protein
VSHVVSGRGRRGDARSGRLCSRRVDNSRYSPRALVQCGDAWCDRRDDDLNIREREYDDYETPATSAASASTGTAAAAITQNAQCRPGPLPQRSPVPPDDAPSPNVVLGRIEIPKIGLERLLGEGITPPAIDRGPTHWPGTAMPGQYGNVASPGTARPRVARSAISTASVRATSCC